MLWIALHLPLLSLESFANTLPPALKQQPLALMDALRILSVNRAAKALGVQPGIKRATALALAPHLTLGQVDTARDHEALTAVAHVALAFTPTVAIQPTSDRTQSPDTVLLDVHGSLRYFGGLPELLQRLHAALVPLGHQLKSASAPTPLAAALLARLPGNQHHGHDAEATARALDAAPVWLFGPGREHWDALQGMGLRCVSELRAMPRSGLARRFGPALLDELDRAFGTRPDPREPIVLPPVFESRLELLARADSTEPLLYGAAVLIARLVAWLTPQHGFVRRFSLNMQHERHGRGREDIPAETTLDIALAEPSRDAAHLQLLLRERLARLQLPAPTLELRLFADDIAKRAAPNVELFPTPQSEHEGLVRLIERLQARLGAAQIQRVVAVADHRPERASRMEPAGASMAARGRARPQPDASDLLVRPIWLLHPPEALAERAEGPLLQGRLLQLLSGPERIETGWWDADLAERDYFIAQTGEGALVWVYRARLQTSARVPGWFLQGRFG